MAFTTRLLLTPVPRPNPTGPAGPPATVTGVTLRFAQFGASKSAVAVATQPAQIELIGRFFKSVRHAPEERIETLGIIQGEMWLQGRPPRARFSCDPASLEALSAAAKGDPADPNADQVLPRAIDLFFDENSFVPCKSVSPQLVLPDFAPQYAYLEVMAELKVGVMIEARRSENDILDVPIWRDSPPRARAYQVQVVDEVGDCVPKVTLEFSFDGQTVVRTTDDKGIAKVLSSSSATATVNVRDPDSLTPDLKSRWTKVRGKPVAPLEPDKLDRQPRELDVAFDAKTSKRELLRIRPPVAMARLSGANFAPDKCFLLPNAMASVQQMVKFYNENEVAHDASPGAPTNAPKTEVLIVGHTDTTADPDHNFELSAERAEAFRAYLLDDYEAWLKWFASAPTQKKLWGAEEEQLMIEALVPPNDCATKGPVLAYQEWHNAGSRSPKRPKDWASLKADGKMGSDTRKQLVIDYMNEDGTTLSPSVRVVCYGAGEMYPLVEADGDVDMDATDDTAAQEDRRVEVFFFSKPFGILPPVPGVAEGAAPKKAIRGKTGQQEYLEWRRRAYKMLPCLNRFITLRLYLHDDKHQLMRNATCELNIAGDVRKLVSDGNGCVVTSRVLVPNTCHVRWNPDPDYIYEADLDLNFSDDASGDLREEDEIRLNNLGYRERSFDEAWKAFQDDWGLTPTKPWFDKAVHDKLIEVHATGLQAQTTASTATV